MKTIFNTFLSLIFLSLVPNNLFSSIDKNKQKQIPTNNYKSLSSACAPATGYSILSTNNVRMQIMTAGDMWWDIFNTQNARYEIPKGSGINSLFASGIWIGGFDVSNNLKLAAMTYRQTGNDFWPGPLSTVDASVDNTTCVPYDKHFRITRAEVEEFYNEKILGANTSGYIIPSSIVNWPGSGDFSKNQAQYLAPYYDNNADGIYDPYDGDYPLYDINGTMGCGNVLRGDETLWWVFNDKGNIHTESSGSLSIGLEIHAQAFAYSTSDEINNMTFYTYKIINRSSETLYNTYMGQWVDADLGNCEDDYIGCDVERGVGYVYNGDNIDDASNGTCSGATAYGSNPPSLGIDFINGPFADAMDGIDNDRDGTLDELGEEIIMSKFVYYNNNNSIQGNPNIGQDFYNYLSGYWRDGSQITYGGNGYGGATSTNFMFPGSSDPNYWCTNGITPSFANWSEYNTNGAGGTNTPGDRRFLISAGKFTLLPGAVNYVTIAAVWGRDLAGDNLAGVQKMLLADDKVQALFDNCFPTSMLERQKTKVSTKIYPNPFASSATIEFSNPQGIAHIIELYNLQGKLMKSIKTTDNKVRIEKDNLNSGIYLYSIKNENESIGFGKFVVN